MSITTVTSRKILPTTLAAALATILMMTGCSKQNNEDTAATDTQAETAQVGTKTKTSAAGFSVIQIWCRPLIRIR